MSTNAKDMPIVKLESPRFEDSRPVLIAPLLSLNPTREIHGAAPLTTESDLPQTVTKTDERDRSSPSGVCQLSAAELAPELDHPGRIFGRNLTDLRNGCLLLVGE